MISLGKVTRFQRACEMSAACYHGSLALYRELDSCGAVALMLHTLGLLAMAQNDQPRARSLFRASMARDLKAKWATTSLWNVWGFARLALAAGQARRAAQHLAAAGRRSIPVIQLRWTGMIMSAT